MLVGRIWVSLTFKPELLQRGADMSELLDELSTTCQLCRRLHIDCDTCPCVQRLGHWVIEGCDHCRTRDDTSGADSAMATG